MKPQSAAELDVVCQSINPKGCYFLDQIYFDESQVGLFLNTEIAQPIWLWVDFRPQTFSLLILQKPLMLKKSKVKPLYTFLKTHGLGKQLTRLERVSDLGRVVHVTFEDLNLEIRMIKNQKNIIITLDSKGKKPVSLYKVATLPQNIETPIGKSLAPQRDLDGMVNEWSASQFVKGTLKHNSSSGAQANPISEGERAFSQKLEKLKKSIDQIKKTIDTDDSAEWQSAGDWLKNNPKGSPPIQYLRFISNKKSFSENVNHIFTQAKKLKANQLGQKKRLQELESELHSVEKVTDPALWLETQKQKRRAPNKKLNDIPHKNLRLSSGHPFAVGRSAHQNLALLRASNPWDLWIHLKDYPSAHGMITKNKGEVMTDALLREAAHLLVESSMKKRVEMLKGEKFVIVAAEKRFVKPIKGSVGLVEYQSERTFSIQF